MKVVCKLDNIQQLDKELDAYAYTQDSTGKVDLTIGKEYSVYGTRANKLGKFYLVLTDTINTQLPWWMPADLFDVSDESVPSSWGKTTWEGYGQETVRSNPIYFDAMEDVEDGTDKGHEVFEKMKENI